jgi:carbonic anhydrase/acetyltransferase-like protein (isoleucine patch superfamily)
MTREAEINADDAAFEGTTPSVHPDASVSPAATLVGDVTIEAGVSVWPGAVLRGDMEPVVVGSGTHVEDNVTVHMSQLGTEIMVGHGVVIDAATVGDGCLLGNNAAINRGTTIGDRCIVAAGAVIPDGRELPPESFVRGVPATVDPLVDSPIDAEGIFEYYSADIYTNLVERYDGLFE